MTLDNVEIKKIFFRKIKKYNDMGSYQHHFVKISKNEVMFIHWDKSWSYIIYELEEKK